MPKQTNNLQANAQKDKLNAATFQQVFLTLEGPLKSYLYRLVTDRHYAEDLAQDTYLKALNALDQFKGESSVKTWVFSIATNLAHDHLKKLKRWPVDVKLLGKNACLSNENVMEAVLAVNQSSPPDAFEMREHISQCFTCMSKTLEIEKQIALILKDIYGFKVAEIAMVLDKSDNVVKHLLLDSRKTMTDIFDKRCALVNKDGVCHQCTELNGWFNPKQDRHQALMQIEMARDSHKYDRRDLYKLRAKLVKGVDTLNSAGTNIQDILMQCDRFALGEISTMKPELAVSKH